MQLTNVFMSLLSSLNGYIEVKSKNSLGAFVFKFFVERKIALCLCFSYFVHVMIVMNVIEQSRII